MSRHIISVGIIGAGQVVQQSHLPVLLALDGCHVAWVADANDGLASMVGNAFGVPAVSLARGTESLPPVDVALLAIPYGARAPYFEYFRRCRQKALYVEKPFAKTLREHRVLSDGYSASNLGVGFSRRAQTSTCLVARLIQDRVFGPVRECRFEFGGTGGGSFGSKYYSNAQLAGGGFFLETGIHGIDAVLYVLNTQPAQCKSLRTVFEDGFDLHVEATWGLSMDDGSAVDFHFVTTRLRDVTNRIEIGFDNHRLVWPFMNDGAVEVTTRTGQSRYCLKLAEGIWPKTPYQTLADYWTAFFSGLDRGAANLTSASTTEGVTRIVEQVYSQQFPSTGKP